MCGIAAAYAYAGAAAAVDRDELLAVRDHMAARGPDGKGEWFSPDGRAGLVHRRLAIIDLTDRAAQPMPSADGSAVISFNGEIYNWRELRDGLAAAGRIFRSDSDTEVLLHLYEVHGTAMLTMLRGMFAFVIWDARRREMLLARDAFGIKPLYYADDGRTLRAASQVKALLSAKVDTSPEPAGHAGFFLWGSVPEPWTLYRGIRCLPAGHWLRVGESGAGEPQPFLRLRDVIADACSNPAAGNRSDAAAAIADAIRGSVRAHLVSDVPVGLFLSAGLDSAMLAHAMTQAGSRPNSITLGFEEFAGSSNDERTRAGELARALQFPHTAPTITGRDFGKNLPQFLASMDQPSIDGVNTWFVARAAAAAGMKVAISGVGGDELLGSYPSFAQVPALRNAMRWPSRIPGAGYVVRRLASPIVRHWGSPKYAGLLEYGGTTGGAYFLRRGLFMPWELPGLMDPDMARAGWQDLSPLVRLDDESRMPAHRASDRLQVTALEMAFYMRNQLLRDADWAGMAHSLEIRVPFVDLTLLKATMPHVVSHPSLSKAEVAQAVAPLLPKSWLDRPKTGFHTPVRNWVALSGRSRHGLRPWARMVIERARLEPSAHATRPRVLVSTLEPRSGGVYAMTRFVIDTLEKRGLEPVIAHYAPYSVTPALSVPSFRLLQRGVGWQQAHTDRGYEIHAIGAWLPELEFTHYAATPRWRELIGGCSAHLSVSGNILAATPYWQCGRPFLAWVATDWHGDREDRVRHFHPLRKVLDRVVNGPIIRWLEGKLLRSGQVLPLSEYTRRELSQIAQGTSFGDVLPSGIDTDLFVPQPARRVPRRIGFAGRFTDPRKNIGLMLAAVARLRSDGHDVHASIMGDIAGAQLHEQVRALGLEGHVEFLAPLKRDELAQHLQCLDVFIVPSHQEGLCIAALEAMACGVPVVATRCGGPEEFVIDGQTGFLADADPASLAKQIMKAIGDPGLHDHLARGARQLVVDRYSLTRTRQIFWDSFSSTFPHVAAAAQPA